MKNFKRLNKYLKVKINLEELVFILIIAFFIVGFFYLEEYTGFVVLEQNNLNIIEINKPVEWVKIVNQSSIEIPASAFNISVKDEEGEEINKSNIKVKIGENLISLKEFESNFSI